EVVGHFSGCLRQCRGVARIGRGSVARYHGAISGSPARPAQESPMNAPENKRLTAEAGVDLSHWWMPFTANRQFKANPRLVSSAKGVFYKTPEGREILDATSGHWCVNAGHGREEIVSAAARQLQEMDF